MAEEYRGRLRLFVEIGDRVQEVQGRRLGSRVLNAAYPRGVPQSQEETVMGAVEYLTRVLGKVGTQAPCGTHRIGVVYAENGTEHRRYIPDNISAAILDLTSAVNEDEDHLAHLDVPPERDHAEILVNWLDRDVPELPAGYQSGRLPKARDGETNETELAAQRMAWEGGSC